MTLITLRALTWGTVTAAVVSALLLAATESGLPDAFVPWRNHTPLPSEPTAAIGDDDNAVAETPHDALTSSASAPR